MSSHLTAKKYKTIGNYNNLQKKNVILITKLGFSGFLYSSLNQFGFLKGVTMRSQYPHEFTET